MLQNFLVFGVTVTFPDLEKIYLQKSLMDFIHQVHTFLILYQKPVFHEF